MSALPERAEDEIRVLNRDFNQVFDRPFSVDGREIVVKIKSGLACYPEDGKEPHALVQNAEAALKEAKTSGEQYLHHRIEMNSELARRVGMEHRLRSALDERAVRAALPAESDAAHRQNLERRGVAALARSGKWIDRAGDFSAVARIRRADAGDRRVGIEASGRGLSRMAPHGPAAR